MNAESGVGSLGNADADKAGIRRPSPPLPVMTFAQLTGALWLMKRGACWCEVGAVEGAHSEVCRAVQTIMFAYHMATEAEGSARVLPVTDHGHGGKRYVELLDKVYYHGDEYEVTSMEAKDGIVTLTATLSPDSAVQQPVIRSGPQT